MMPPSRGHGTGPPGCLAAMWIRLPSMEEMLVQGRRPAAQAMPRKGWALPAPGSGSLAQAGFRGQGWPPDTCGGQPMPVSQLPQRLVRAWPCPGVWEFPPSALCQAGILGFHGKARGLVSTLLLGATQP